MKKFVAAAALLVMSLCFAGNISAGNFGVLGGANFPNASISAENATRWHAGIAYKVSLPLGFHVQPTLLYSVKATDVSVDGLKMSNLSVGYMQLMASVQWGIDLILLRPFVDVSPFAGYGVNGFGQMKEDWKKVVNSLDYGLGLGGGLDVWRFQVAARYNWSFSNPDLRGVTLSLAYFF